MSRKSWQQSFYHPKNPEKYKGDKVPFARSSWELSYMEYFDNNSEIIEWASESFSIPYIKPTDGRIHMYVPDFIVVYRDPTGETRVEVIEVKPYAQSRPSRAKNPSRRLVETTTYAVNSAKWVAAQKWCDDRGFKFRVLTEKGDMTAQWAKSNAK